MMDDLLLGDDHTGTRFCKVWTKMWNDINDRGHLVLMHESCKGEMELTRISESPRISQWKCKKCGNDWRVRNGMIYPIPISPSIEIDEDELYQAEQFDFL